MLSSPPEFPVPDDTEGFVPYPSHFLPVVVHLLQNGFASSHFTRRILDSGVRELYLTYRGVRLCLLAGGTSGLNFWSTVPPTFWNLEVQAIHGQNWRCLRLEEPTTQMSLVYLRWAQKHLRRGIKE